LRINEWFNYTNSENSDEIGIMHKGRNDFQSFNVVYLSNRNIFDHTAIIDKNNLHIAGVYIAVQKVIKQTWLNDRG